MQHPVRKSTKAKQVRDLVFASRAPTDNYQKRLGPLADPFPPRRRVTMQWCELFNQTSATVTGQCGTEKVFKINSLFNPNASDTHKPYGWSTLASLYYEYLVRRVRVELTVTTGAGGTHPTALAVEASPNIGFISLTGLSLSDVMEKTDCDLMHINATGLPTKKTFVIDLASLNGLAPRQYEDDLADWAGSQIADPAKTSYFRFAVVNLADTTAVSVSVLVRIFFECEWFNRITLASSN